MLCGCGPNFCTNLSSLDAYMFLFNSNIEKFNQYVSECVKGLKARGEKSEDLVNNPFKGYKGAEDKKFVEYVALQETWYFDGSDLSADKLIQLAENKYIFRIDREYLGRKVRRTKANY